MAGVQTQACTGMSRAYQVRIQPPLLPLVVAARSLLPLVGAARCCRSLLLSHVVAFFIGGVGGQTKDKTTAGLCRFRAAPCGSTAASEVAFSQPGWMHCWYVAPVQQNTHRLVSNACRERPLNVVFLTRWHVCLNSKYCTTCAATQHPRLRQKAALSYLEVQRRSAR